MVEEQPSGRGVEKRNALSRRESEILRLGSDGATDKEIAEALGITVATLRTHWTRVRDRLGAVDRTHAIVLSSAPVSAAPVASVRERLVSKLAHGRVSSWVWRGRSRQAHLDEVGCLLFGLSPADDPVPAERLFAHIWAPDRARFERFLFQGGEVRALTPIEIRAGMPGDYCNLVRTANVVTDGGSDPALLLTSIRLHVFR